MEAMTDKQELDLYRRLMHNSGEYNADVAIEILRAYCATVDGEWGVNESEYEWCKRVLEVVLND
jgi:hypothetical protein